jgi:hypothetical protein
MQIAHDGLAGSDFPPRASVARLRCMTDVLTADLTLRFPAGRLAGRVHWPRAMTSEEEAPPLVLLLDADEAYGAELCAPAGAVVLAAGGCERSALEWAAEHAAELGAGRLAVAGRHAAAARAVRLALAARDDGWPPLHRLLLIDPRLAPLPTLLEGIAPAAVLGGCDADRYVARLRWSGVPVDVLRRPADLFCALRWKPCECGSSPGAAPASATRSPKP